MKNKILTLIKDVTKVVLISICAVLLLYIWVVFGIFVYSIFV